MKINDIKREFGQYNINQQRELLSSLSTIHSWKLENLNKIYSAQNTYTYLMHKIGFKEKEYLCVLLLDRDNRLIKEEILTIGTENQTLISNKDICYFAIKNQAKAVIIAHNHPSGDCFPSAEDKEVTRKLKKALENLETPLLDHLIITKDKFFSFKKEGIL